MKRMHIHIGVEQLEKSINFYSALFGTEPVKTKKDYAKWMLTDPYINFAISTRAEHGIDHLGIQVDDASELEELRGRLQAARMSVFDEGEAVCCYAKSDKSWVKDPSGVAWEAYRTMEDAELFSEGEHTPGLAEACCTPENKGQPGCCDAKDTAAVCC